MKGKHITCFAAFAAAILGPLPATAADGAAPPLESVIGEDVELWLGVRDLSGLRERWDGHPLRRVAENRELREAFGADADASGGSGDKSGFTKVMEEEFGLDYDELFALFPGQAGIAVFDLAGMAAGAPGERDLAILAEFSGSEERLNELMRIQFERNAEAQKEANPDMEHVLLEERFMGETLYLDEASDGENTFIEDGYALVDGIAVLAAPTERLRGLVEAIKAGADAPLADDPVYLRSRDAGARGDAGVYLNLAQWLRPKSEAWLGKLAESGLARFGVTAESLRRALAPDAPEAAFYEADLEADGVLAHGGLLYREKAGLLQLLNYGEGRLPEAGYVPESALASTVSVFDLSGMLGRLESILTQASPNLAPLIEMQLQKVKDETGVDLRGSVLENFGNEMVSFSVSPGGDQPDGGGAALQAPQFYALEIGDARAFSDALEAFKDLAPGLSGMMASREYAGETIHVLRPPQPGGSGGGGGAAFSYAVTRSHFLFSAGEPRLMRETLARMDGGADGLWQRPETRRMFDRIGRSDAVSRSYADLEAMARVIAAALQQARSVAKGGAPGGGAGGAPDFSISGDWAMASELNERSDGLFMRVLITAGGDGS